MRLEQFGGLGYCRLATLRSPLGLVAAAAQASPHAIALARVDLSSGGQTLRSFRADTLRRPDASSAGTAEPGGAPREEGGGMILAVKLLWRPAAAEAEGGAGRFIVVAGYEDGSLALWDLGADGQGKGQGGIFLSPNPSLSLSPSRAHVSFPPKFVHRLLSAAQ
jgi:hypothetical protein